MARADNGSNRWFWYTAKTSDCVPLDRGAYPATIYDGQPYSWPEWACRSPDGGIHIDARRGPIDVNVATTPNNRDELNWTCEFGVFVVAHSWLAGIADLIDGDRITVGRLALNGEPLKGWSTIHERRPPPLFATEGRTRSCAICGHAHTTVHGRVYFSDPAVGGRPLMVNGNGLFVREDLARSRNLRTPVGAFKPSAVKLKAE